MSIQYLIDILQYSECWQHDRIWEATFYLQSCSIPILWLSRKMMLRASDNKLRTEKGGHPQYHNSDTFVINHCLLFKKIHEVHIDSRYETKKDCINTASDKRYQNRIIPCLLHLSKNCHPGLKLWTGEGKVVWDELGQIMLHLQPLHH